MYAKYELVFQGLWIESVQFYTPCKLYTFNIPPQGVVNIQRFYTTAHRALYYSQLQ